MSKEIPHPLLRFLEHDVPSHYEADTGKKPVHSSYYQEMVEIVRKKDFEKLQLLKFMLNKDLRILENVISLTGAKLDYGL